MYERMKQVRKTLGMNQMEFSRALGVTNAHISKLEKGGCRPSKLLITAICKEFGINKEWLEKGEGEMIIEHADREEKAMEKENKENLFKNYVDTYPYIAECVNVKTEGNDLMKALEILDLIKNQEESVHVKTALAILDDAKAILMETVTI